MKVQLTWPDPALSPNRKNGKHWSSVHGKKERRFVDARMITVQSMRDNQYVPPPGLLPLVITFVMPDKRRRDLDNLLASIKSDLDGVSKALGVDDQLFEPITLQREYGGKPGRIVLEIGHGV